MINRISIHQPEFCPWLGFFHKVASSNIFVLLDNVQFNSQDYQNRNKILIAGHQNWITVPVQKHSFDTKIKDIHICNTNMWQRRIQNQLFPGYRNEKYYNDIMLLLHDMWEKEWEKIVDLNSYIIRQIIDYLNLDVILLNASEIVTSNLFDQMTGSNKVLYICEELRATNYLSGIYGKYYLEENKFLQKKISVEYSQYPVENVNYSILHYLFKFGKDTRNLLKGAV